MAVRPTAILLAKLPRPGAVKTRLAGPEGFSEADAARVAAAMLGCTVERLAARWRLVIALAPDGSGDDLRAMLPEGTAETVEIIDQGEGDLGDRIDRAWHAVGLGQPVDVAQAAYWLLTPEAQWVNGQAIVVDGGGIMH